MSTTLTATTREHYTRLADVRRRLLALYDGETLRRRPVAREHRAPKDWTWGYELLVGGVKATGSSIGVDEVRIFAEIADLIEMRSAYTVGVAFGFSLFALALAAPDATVVGIDDYSERAGPGTQQARRLVERIITTECPNARLVVGRSPADTPMAVADLAPLSLVFIDGAHNAAAASADYAGVRPFLDARSVVLWHDTETRDMPRAFAGCFDRAIHDRCARLNTYGRLGIHHNSTEHPALAEYLDIARLTQWRAR
jgi:predicted O-methyltransferase YrrM